MNLKEIQDELLALAARSVTLANELGKVLGSNTSPTPLNTEVNWCELSKGDKVRVTMVSGDVVEDVVGMVEHRGYEGDMPFYLENADEWIGEAGTNHRATYQQFVKIEKLA